MNVDLPFAPVSILFFLASCMAVVACFAIIVYARLTQNPRLARVFAILLAGGLGVYTILLLGVTLASHDRLLGRGEEKHFCEVDCHIAYSVTDVKSQPAADGSTYIVTLQTRFDQATIDPRRGNGVLQPSPHFVFLVDAGGRRFCSADGEVRRRMREPLRPGESYLTKIEFTLPPGVSVSRLLVAGEQWPNWLLIGHENSPWHKKTYFRLTPSST